MIELGLISSANNGFFTILPLAHRSIEKCTRIVDYYMKKVGAQKISLPSLTSVDLWKKSGKWRSVCTLILVLNNSIVLNDVGRFGKTNTELLTTTDSHDKEYILGPVSWNFHLKSNWILKANLKNKINFLCRHMRKRSLHCWRTWKYSVIDSFHCDYTKYVNKIQSTKIMFWVDRHVNYTHVDPYLNSQMITDWKQIPWRTATQIWLDASQGIPDERQLLVWHRPFECYSNIRRICPNIRGSLSYDWSWCQNW